MLHGQESSMQSESKKEVFETKQKKEGNCSEHNPHKMDLLNNVLTLHITDVANITVLDLSHCNLTTLPLECKRLNLERLSLSHNNLKEVPLCIYSGLKLLKSLDLSYNQIICFDLEPECLPYVNVIKLNNNRFENVPKWFLMFKCTNLEEFNYSNNKAKTYKYFKNSINLGIMKLRKLELISSCLIDNDFNLLKSFKLLKYLDISNDGSRLGLKCINQFDEADDLFVKPRWQELHVLKLNNLCLSIFPEGIAWVYSLKELYVTKNSLSWLPDGCEYLINLEILDISDNEIVAIPGFVLALEKLSILRAFNNSIEIVPDLAQMPCLKTVDLYNNLLDEVVFDTSNFEFVDLERNYFCTENIEYSYAYEEKKNSLRKKYKLENRSDGIRLPPVEPPTSSDTSDDEDNYDNKPVKYIKISQDDDEEDWDMPVENPNLEARKSNPEIDSVDNEWQGEEQTGVKKLIPKPKSKVYVSDDDWMFEDIPEEN